MATSNLPGTDAARHGTGDADLTIMLAAHAAFRRDLARLAHTTAARQRDPSRHAAIQAGWETFKRQLHLHHTAEDTIIWPALRQRLDHSDHAQSVLDAMEEEHQLIDPLLAAVDAAFAEPDGSSLGDATAALTTSLTAHLTHEERDGLPLIGVALTAARMALRRLQDRPQQRPLRRRRNVRLASRRRRQGHRGNNDRHPAPTRKSAIPRNLETPLRPHPTLVSTFMITQYG